MENKIVILYKEFDDRFFTTYYTSIIKKLFEEYKKYFLDTGNKITVDIKFCKFNPDNHSLIVNYCDYINFIDSDNTIINDMLVHNSRVSSMLKLQESGDILIEPIPSRYTMKEAFDYIANLDKSKIYRIKGYNELNGIIADPSILIAMCINYLYPTVSVDISAQCSRYFQIFRNYWSKDAKIINRDSYHLLWQNNILKINSFKKDSRGRNVFYIPGTGNITEDVLAKNFDIIPYEFGTKDVSKDVELNGIYVKIAKDIQNICTITNKKKKLLSDELEIIRRG